MALPTYPEDDLLKRIEAQGNTKGGAAVPVRNPLMPRVFGDNTLVNRQNAGLRQLENSAPIMQRGLRVPPPEGNPLPSFADRGIRPMRTGPEFVQAVPQTKALVTPTPMNLGTGTVTPNLAPTIGLPGPGTAPAGQATGFEDAYGNPTQPGAGVGMRSTISDKPYNTEFKDGINSIIDPSGNQGSISLEGRDGLSKNLADRVTSRYGSGQPIIELGGFDLAGANAEQAKANEIYKQMADIQNGPAVGPGGGVFIARDSTGDNLKRQSADHDARVSRLRASGGSKYEQLKNRELDVENAYKQRALDVALRGQDIDARNQDVQSNAMLEAAGLRGAGKGAGGVDAKFLLDLEKFKADRMDRAEDVARNSQLDQRTAAKDTADLALRGSTEQRAANETFDKALDAALPRTGGTPEENSARAQTQQRLRELISTDPRYQGQNLSSAPIGEILKTLQLSDRLDTLAQNQSGTLDVFEDSVPGRRSLAEIEKDLTGLRKGQGYRGQQIDTKSVLPKYFRDQLSADEQELFDNLISRRR